MLSTYAVGGRTGDAFSPPCDVKVGDFKPFGTVAVVWVVACITPESGHFFEVVECYEFLVAAVVHVGLWGCYLHLEVCDVFRVDF